MLRLTCALALSCLCAVSLGAQQDRTATPNARSGKTCWDGPVVRNRDGSKNKMPSMPAKFAGRKITNTVAVFSACVESDGSIAKVLTSRSSGDADVDAFYRDAILKWKVAPEERRGKKVRSVLTVVVTLAIS